jgi:hypothetical protein
MNAVEFDLGISLAATPTVLAAESYGWAEEGGDRSLLRLGSGDCVSVRNLLDPPALADPSSDYIRMFDAQGLHPRVVFQRYSRDEHGDHRHYVLDLQSCVLYREAHFE